MASQNVRTPNSFASIQLRTVLTPGWRAWPTILRARIRGEALRGLARRRDTGIAPVVQHELAGEFHGDWAVEAAELLCDPQFLQVLRRLYERLDGANAIYFAAACRAQSRRVRVD